MIKAEEKVIEILIERGNRLLRGPYKRQEFTGNAEADNLLNDLKNYPHAFVLACVMDRRMTAERAWVIPYEISKEIGGFSLLRLLKLSLSDIKRIFKRKSLHRFNDIMANNFYLAIQKVRNEYRDVASNIWKNKPRSATVVRRFLEFNGVGIKIATMATNILARDFKIAMNDYICIDISPDMHVKKVFKRLGLISKDGSNEELIYRARELNPEYPGIFDLSCWEIGRNWCYPNSPACKECYLNKYCPKNFTNLKI